MSWTMGTQLLLLVLLITVIILSRLLFQTFFQNKDEVDVWTKVEPIGVSSGGIFSWTRAVIGSAFSYQQNTQDGYDKFCKAQNRPFILPTMWTGGSVVVLPPSLLHLTQKVYPSMARHQAKMDHLQLPYMISDRDVIDNLIQFDIARKKLRQAEVVSSLAAITEEEIDVAFRKYWGTSETWTSINAWDNCTRVITQAGFRILIGLPLCRDESLLENARMYANYLFKGTSIINCMPPFSRPVLARIISWPSKYYQARCRRILRPLIEQRIRGFKDHKAGSEKPDDFLQWLIEHCSKLDAKEMEPDKISDRILVLCIAFVFAMGYIFCSSVLDLYKSPEKTSFVAGLVAECKCVSAEHGGLSTKQAVDSLFRVDSALRESMRVSDVGATSIPIDVVSGKVDLGNGIQIPSGMRMVFATQPMHLDPDSYPNPLRYDAFRFSRKYEEIEKCEQELGERELCTTITESFLPFGYGKFQCPGRWFATQTIKQALAYVAMNYDIEFDGRQYKRQALLNMMLPPEYVEMSVRRRRA
ncbi:hypothetical protein ABEW05_011074 [Botrytis cinerea]